MYFFSETDKHTKMLCFKDTPPKTNKIWKTQPKFGKKKKK